MELALDLPRNAFKHAIAAGRQQIGFWCSLASHVSVEIVAGSGFDWPVLDTEHSPHEIPLGLTQPHAVLENKVHPIVRPAWNDMVLIKRYLDMGVQTLLIPVVGVAGAMLVLGERARGPSPYDPRRVLQDQHGQVAVIRAGERRQPPFQTGRRRAPPEGQQHRRQPHEQGKQRDGGG